MCSLRGKCLKVTESNGRKEEWGAGGGGGGGGGEKEIPLPSRLFLTRPVLPSFTKGATSFESFTGDFGMRETMAVNCFRTSKSFAGQRDNRKIKFKSFHNYVDLSNIVI